MHWSGSTATYDVVYTDGDATGALWTEHGVTLAQIHQGEQEHEVQGRAMQVLRNMTWANMVATVAESIGPQQPYRKRANYFNPHKLYAYSSQGSPSASRVFSTGILYTNMGRSAPMRWGLACCGA